MCILCVLSSFIRAEVVLSALISPPLSCCTFGSAYYSFRFFCLFTSSFILLFLSLMLLLHCLLCCLSLNLCLLLSSFLSNLLCFLNCFLGLFGVGLSLSLGSSC